MKPLLEARQICKQFSGVAVLKGIDFTLGAGQVHALMGGNGAGKSTLMKIIAGVETPDSGELTIGDRAFARLTRRWPTSWASIWCRRSRCCFPTSACARTFSFVCRSGRIPPRGCRKTAAAELPINLDASASTLEVADQQMVEILRGLMREAQDPDPG